MRRGIFYLAVLLWVCLSGTAIRAEKIDSFSATQVIVHESGEVETTGRIYIDKGKIRYEMQSPKGTGKWIVIARPDLNKHWMLNPAKGKYFEQAYSPEELKQLLHSVVQTNEEKILGEETIQGFVCRKVEISSQLNNETGQVFKTIVWQNERFPMPIRTKGANGQVMEFQDIKREAPDETLFELPPGYQKVETMVGLFSTEK